ncbi:MAG: hypothetical protein KDA71_03355, partial [Planctomycetales bacterium]|nr:hypothetical protein [Planctomycetales bacterium]
KGADDNPAETPAAETPAAEPKVADELAYQQGVVADKFDKLEKELFRLAELEGPTNPQRAALSKQATQLSKENFTLKEMNKVVLLLNREDLKNATTSQEVLVKDLRALLELLVSENRTDRIKSERERIQEYIKELVRLQRLQAANRGRTEGGADADQLAKNQGQIADRTGNLEQKIGEDEAANQPGSGEAGEGESKGDSDGKSDSESEGESKSDSEGKSKGDSESKSKGDSEGKSKGESEGDSKSESEGDSKSDSEGKSKGDSESKSKGDSEGKSKGESEGDSKSESEGDSKGDSEGKSKGDSEGKSKGDKEGDSKGESEGDTKGDSEGDSKGDSEGKSKGDKQGGQSQGQSQGGGGGESESESGESGEQQEQNPARQRIQEAQQKMQEAKQRLEEAKRKESVEAQREAEQKLREAIAELERILRQLREEEIERMLALLESRFTKMLQMQLKVYEDTKRLGAIPETDRDRTVEQRAANLAFDERKIVIEADKALTLLLEEGSSIAFPEAVEQMREDMEQVAERLADVKVDRITQGIEEDIIRALEEMIEALQKAQQDQENRQQQQQQQQQGQPQDQPLVDQIAELKMIRALQLRVNTRTQRYARLLDDSDDEVGQATDNDLQEAIRKLAEREDDIRRITRDIVLGKNK